MAQAVLRATHMMLGLDWHIPWPPGAPGPVPAAVPYVTGQLLKATSVTCLHAPAVFTEGGAQAMLKGTDIGPKIIHAGPLSLTLPIEMATSGSKSHFGASSIEVEDQHGKPGNLASAVLGLAGLNLNCGTPAPQPFGAVIAPTTVQESMRLGDVVAGVVSMACDYMVQRIVARVGGMALGGSAKGLEAIGRRLGAGGLGRVAARYASGDVAEHLGRFVAGVKLWGATPLDFVIGSPLGASISNVRVAHGETIFPSVLDRVTAGSARLGAATEDAVKAYLDDPSVADVPASPPTHGLQPTRGE